MSPGEIEWLSLHHEEMLSAISVVTFVGGLGVFGFVMQYGGHRRIEDHLRSRSIDTATAAKSKVKRGLRLRDGDDADEAHCVDSLIAGLDEWRRHGESQSRRSARIARARGALYLMVLTVLVAWVAQFATTEFTWFEAVPLLAWVVPFLVGIVAVWPVAGELLEHGLPRETAEVPDPRVLPQPAPSEQIVTQTEAVKQDQS